MTALQTTRDVQPEDLVDLKHANLLHPAKPARKLILAIDYDQTLELLHYPHVGRLAPLARMVMQQLADDGHTLIIWTVREGQELADALAFLRSQDVPFHEVNKNAPQIIEAWKCDPRKIFADLYLDDRAALLSEGGIDWLGFYFQVNRVANEL